MLFSASDLECSRPSASATYYCAASNDSVVATMHDTTRVIRLASSKAGFESYGASGYASTIFALDTYATKGVWPNLENVSLPYGGLELDPLNGGIASCAYGPSDGILRVTFKDGVTRKVNGSVGWERRVQINAFMSQSDKNNGGECTDVFKVGDDYFNVTRPRGAPYVIADELRVMPRSVMMRRLDTADAQQHDETVKEEERDPPPINRYLFARMLTKRG